MVIVDCPVPLPVKQLPILQKVDFIAVHCSASQPIAGYGAAEIDRIHKQRGFKCIGYHYVIRTTGVVEKGRPERTVGAHVEGFNSRSIGVCLVGGVDSTGKSTANFTQAQYGALAALIDDLKHRYPNAVVQGHRDFPDVAKDCPCFDVKKWLVKK